MICFGDVARQIIGKPVQQLLRTVTTGGPLPVDIAKIISRRFTFAVTLTQQSYYRQDRTYQVTSVVTAHGQHEPAPPVAQHGPPPSVDQRSATAPTTSNIVHNTLTVVPADEVVLPSLSGTGGKNSLALLASTPPLNVLVSDTPAAEPQSKEESGKDGRSSSRRKLVFDGNDDKLGYTADELSDEEEIEDAALSMGLDKAAVSCPGDVPPGGKVGEKKRSRAGHGAA